MNLDFHMPCVCVCVCVCARARVRVQVLRQIRDLQTYDQLEKEYRDLKRQARER